MAAPIQFTQPVQSLGREDVNAPGRVAMARANAATKIAVGLEDLEKTVAAHQYTENMSTARNSINELYDTVVSKEVFSSSEVPDFVTGFERYEEIVGRNGEILVQERQILGSEIREKWFKQGLQNIANVAVQSSTAPTARKRISTELRTAIGPAAYNQLLTYNRVAAKKERMATLDATIQTAVVNGDRLGVEAALSRYWASGDITRDDYEARKLDASQNLDIEAYSQDIMQAQDIGQLETIYDSISLNKSLTMPGESDLTAAQRNTLRASASTARSKLVTERKEMQSENEREGLALYTEGQLTLGWIRGHMRNETMERAAGQSLLGLLEGGRAATDLDPLKVSSWQAEAQSRLMFTDFGTQTSDVATAMKRELQTSDLSGIERQKVYDYIDKVSNNITNNPEYKQALSSIRAFTGMPEDANMQVITAMIASGTYGDIASLNAEFSNALFQYIDEFGAEAKPFEFVQKNKSNYEVEDRKKAKQLRFEEAFPELVSPAPTPTNPKVILHNLYELYIDGGSSDSELEQTIAEVYTFWYGTALDIGNL